MPKSALNISVQIKELSLFYRRDQNYSTPTTVKCFSKFDVFIYLTHYQVKEGL